jgi:hypothetical protein
MVGRTRPSPDWTAAQGDHDSHRGGAHILHYPTVTQAHDALGARLAFGRQRFTHYDWAVGTDVGLDNVTLVADSFKWEYDIKRAWILRQRWKTLARQYVPPSELDRWCDMLPATVKRGVNVLRADTDGVDLDDDGSSDYSQVMTTNTVQGKGSGRGVRRRWGSCILSVSYRHRPIPQITLHSRTSYLGYLSLLDITVAENMAAEASAVVGVPVEDMRFVWNLEMAQFHGFRSLAWIMTDPKMRAKFELQRSTLDRSLKGGTESMPPGVRRLDDGLRRIERSDERGTLYGDESFSSFARVRRRLHTEVYGYEHGKQFEGGTRNRGGKKRFAPLPSVSTSTLDFTVLEG